MFFEQYSHEPYVAVARFILQFLKQPDDARLPDRIAGAYRALDVMEQHLATRAYFGGERYTIADIALSPTHTSPMKRTSTCRAIPRSARGLRACAASRVTSRCRASIDEAGAMSLRRCCAGPAPERARAAL